MELNWLFVVFMICLVNSLIIYRDFDTFGGIKHYVIFIPDPNNKDSILLTKWSQKSWFFRKNTCEMTSDATIIP